MLKDQLKLLRDKKSLTKKEVAQAIGITERAYIAYEYGERDVSTDTLIKIAQYYNVSTDYLLGIEQKEPLDPIDLLNLDIQDKALIRSYASLSPAKRKEFLKILKDLATGAEIQLTVKKAEPEAKKERHTATFQQLEESATEEEAKKGA